MSREQVLAVIPVYHPVWAQVDAELIAYVDTHAGHGNFRAWTKLTARVITTLARQRPAKQATALDLAVVEHRHADQLLPQDIDPEN